MAELATIARPYAEALYKACGADLGGTAVWLCSDYGNCTSGEVVHVDCGYHVLGMPQQENL